VVDLMGCYCKQTEQAKRVKRAQKLSAQTWPERNDMPVPPRQKIDQRLTDAVKGEIVDAYRNGASGAELAERYGLARSTVLKVVRAAGGQVRYPRMTAEEKAEVVRLYLAGMRQVDIAAQLGRHKSLIWHILARAGLMGSP